MWLLGRIFYCNYPVHDCRELSFSNLTNAVMVGTTLCLLLRSRCLVNKIDNSVLGIGIVGEKDEEDISGRGK